MVNDFVVNMRVFRSRVLASIAVLALSSVSALAAASNPVPVIYSVAPITIPAGATTTVTLTGNKFVPTSTVLLNGAKVTATYQSTSSILVQVTLASSATGSVSLQVQNPAPGGGGSDILRAAIAKPISVTAATRILDQTTFGPTDALIAHVQAEGLNPWLAEQFRTPTTLLPSVPTTAPVLPCKTQGYCIKTEWWNVVNNGQDQLRQRVAFALSQMFVISDGKDPDDTIPPYMNLLANDAFTNWYQIMTDVTKSTAMGYYLDMLNSPKPAAGQIANENFARENLQLFNIGLYLLNQDGTQQLDSSGNPIPAYTELQVEAFARADTGWTFANLDGSTPSTFPIFTYTWAHPLVAVESAHDTDEKILLNGTVLPPGQTAEQDMAQALTNIFNHPNVAPFVSRLLIQHLVEGDPSPAYVARVAAVFNNNGNGVRGDMRDVLSAIFNDKEARFGDTQVPQENFGHLRDPITWTTHLMRAVGYTNSDPNGYYVPLWHDVLFLGEADYGAPSVFNFYPPEYVIPQTSLNEPEFDLENTGSIGLRRSLADSFLTNQIQNITLNLGSTSPLVKLASNPASLVDELGVLFAHGRLDPNIRTTVINEISTVTDPAQRTRIALYLITTASANKIEN